MHVFICCELPDEGDLTHDCSFMFFVIVQMSVKIVVGAVNTMLRRRQIKRKLIENHVFSVSILKFILVVSLTLVKCACATVR